MAQVYISFDLLNLGSQGFFNKVFLMCKNWNIIIKLAFAHKKNLIYLIKAKKLMYTHARRKKGNK